jgi:hypothetical protein
MKTDTNKMIDKLINEKSEEELSKINFINLNYNDNYGNLLHATINYKNDEEKILILIKRLLELGVDPNFKAPSTGFSFIHLALYGYTDNFGDDYSYSTDFIINLIKLAKEYNLDVNITDKDKETIPEAAIASEVYTGSIIKVMKELGIEFNVTEKITKTLNKYLKISSKEKGSSWNKRLNKEKQEIEEYVKRANLNIDEVNENINLKENELNTYLLNLNTSNLLDTYKTILNITKELKSLYKNKSILTKTTHTSSILDTCTNKIKVEVLNLLKEDLTNKKLEEINKIISLFSLKDIEDLYKEKVTSYTNYLNKLKEESNNINSIDEANLFLSKIKDVEIKDELLSTISKKVETLNKIIDQIKSKEQLLNFLSELLGNNNTKLINYNSLTEEELIKLNTKLTEEIEINKDLILKEVNTKFTDLVTFLKPLLDNNIIKTQYLTDLLNNKLTEVTTSNGRQLRKQ